MTEQTEQTTHDQAADFDEAAPDEHPATASPTGSGAAQQEDREDAGDSSVSEAGIRGGESSGTAADEERAPLFATDDAERFRDRWESLQARFVDEPRDTVAEADDLVGELMKQLTAGFSDKRSRLEAQWEQGDQVSTEDLRIALTRYRSFFNRLLSV
jgi:hypothetical protein